MSGTDLSEAKLYGAKLAETKLRGADLTGADFSANRKILIVEDDLTKANPSVRTLLLFDEGGFSVSADLTGANLRRVKGLTQGQLATCKAKGAIVDEDSTTISSQSPVAPPPPSPSNDAQAPSTPPAQGSIPPPDTGGSGATSSKPGPEP